MGIVGLETAFPVLYTKLVQGGRISLERLLEALTGGPRKAFRLPGGLQPGAAADLVILDLDTPFSIDSRTFLSKGRSTPFDGWNVRGRVLKTLKNGRTVYDAR